MPTHVKTLDSIHLASAQLFAERTNTKILFGTHGQSDFIAAQALGFKVVWIPARI